MQTQHFAVIPTDFTNNRSTGTIVQFYDLHARTLQNEEIHDEISPVKQIGALHYSTIQFIDPLVGLQ